MSSTAELTLKSMMSKNLDEPLASSVIEATDTFPDPQDTKLLPLQAPSRSPSRTVPRF